jgi:hypothetical protein
LQSSTSNGGHLGDTPTYRIRKIKDSFPMGCNSVSNGNWFQTFRKKVVSVKRLELPVASQKISILNVSVIMPMPAARYKSCSVCTNGGRSACHVPRVARFTTVRPRGSSSPGCRCSLTDTSGQSIGQSQGFYPTGPRKHRRKKKKQVT